MVTFGIGNENMEKMIMYEDNSVIVVHKPAGIATQTSKLGQADIVSKLKNYRNEHGESAYIGVIHRLDQPVEGILVFAKDTQTAKNLTHQLNTGILRKKYAALVYGNLSSLDGGELTDYLIKDGRTNLSRVVTEGTKEAKQAKLSWKPVKCYEDYSLVEIELFTGRHHQIRVQMSNAGMPLLGDLKYGTELSKQLSSELGIKNTALLANRLEYRNPTGNKAIQKDMHFNVPYPGEWRIV